MDRSELTEMELMQRSRARADAVSKASQGKADATALAALMFTINSDSSSDEDRSQAQAVWDDLPTEQQSEAQEIHQGFGGTVAKKTDPKPATTAENVATSSVNATTSVENVESSDASSPVMYVAKNALIVFGLIFVVMLVFAMIQVVSGY
jgi:cobalamin biosynthesis Mg chelatase CobN